MLERPDEPALLEALAKFLLADLHPAVADKKLAFRVLIAANIASTLATQLRTAAEHQAAELGRLRALLGARESPGESGAPGVPGAPARAEIRDLNQALVSRLKAGGLPPEELQRIRAHVKQTLEEALSVVTPSFDTSADIE